MLSFPQAWKVLFADVHCPDCIANQWRVELLNALKKRVDKVSGKNIKTKMSMAYASYI